MHTGVHLLRTIGQHPGLQRASIVTVFEYIFMIDSLVVLLR